MGLYLSFLRTRRTPLVNSADPTSKTSRSFFKQTQAEKNARGATGTEIVDMSQEQNHTEGESTTRQLLNYIKAMAVN